MIDKKEFLASLEDLHNILDFIQSYCAKKNLDPSIVNQIMLATEEAVVNVIKYGYSHKSQQTIEIECEDYKNTKSGIKVTITDQGIPFNPIDEVKKNKSRLTRHTDEPVGGYGIFLYTKMMDKVEYQRQQGKNFLYLIKYLT